MGKKKRNDDGSKKKKPKIEDTNNTYINKLIWDFIKGSGGSSSGLHYCFYCEVEVPINPNKLLEHYESNRHKNNHTIHNLLPIFASHGIIWLSNEKKFYCEEHDNVLEYKAKSIIEHIKDHSKVTKVVKEGGNEGFQDNILKVFRHKLWMSDFQSSNAGLNKQLLNYDRVSCPRTLVEDSPSNSFIANFKNGIFTENDLALMVKVASYLENKGDNIDRSEKIQGSKMKVFGMRSTMGDTGWYIHEHKNVYKVALEFVEFVSKKLETHYPFVFKQLRRIQQVEGFNGGEASLGKTPFTTFAVTRDYNCRPHVDVDDYDLGFILWLQEDYIKEDEEVALVAFPEFKISFFPKNGDVLCFRANSYQHCTRALKKKNQLGLAFFQKASLFRQLKKLLELPSNGVLEVSAPERGKKPAKTIYEKKADFEMKKIMYEKWLAKGKLSLENF